MKFLLSFLLVFLFVFDGYSQSVSAAKAASVTEFDVNGLKVIFKRRSSSPTVSAGLFVRGGVRGQTAENAGIEGLTLSAATEAGRKYPREALRKELSHTGTIIGSSSAPDFSVVSLATTSENFDRSWDVFTDIILHPAFAQDDVDRVRNAALAGLRDATSSPDGALRDLEDKIVNAGHPYANDPDGTIATISRLTADDLRAYHKNLLQTSRLLLVVVGDIRLDDLKKAVTSAFSGLPRGTYKETPISPLSFAQPSLDITQRELSTNYIKGVFAAPSLSSPDYYAMRVAIAILKGRVYEEVRTKRNLSYAPDADMDMRAANSAFIYVTAVDANQAVRVMLDEVEKMRTQEIDEDEFTNVPGYFLTMYYLDQETNAAQAGELARYELIGGGWRNAEKFLDGVRSVKPADVLAVAAKYMKNIRFVVIGNRSAIDRSVFLRK